MEQGNNNVHSMTKMAVCIALHCLGAYISFPLPFASAMITALTIVMNLTAFILTPKQTFIVIFTYLLLGIAGLPVFVGGAAGIGEVFGPRGGFLIAFLIAYPLVSLFKGKTNSVKRYALTAILLGIPITYIGGLLSVMWFLKLDIEQAVLISVIPFIPGDIIKAVIAALLGVKLNKILREV